MHEYVMLRFFHIYYRVVNSQDYTPVYTGVTYAFVVGHGLKAEGDSAKNIRTSKNNIAKCWERCQTGTADGGKPGINRKHKGM